MLISHRFQFIYTKTVKTASTSVESYFERFCLPEGEWTPESFRPQEDESFRETYESASGIIGFRGPHTKGQKWYNHMPARRIRDQIGEEVWNRYLKFCVIRDPWEKAISGYEYFARRQAQGIPATWSGRFFHWRHRRLTEEQRRFLYWLLTDGPPIDRDKYMIDGKVCIDVFLRFEHLHADMAALCARLGVPWEEQLMPVHKSGIRRKEASPELLFSEPARKLIERVYAFEIEKFGYRAPGTP